LTNVINSFRYFCWATVCKMVRPMLLDRCLACPFCDICVLWLNGWTDQDEPWHAGRPRPWPHCVRCVPRSPPPKGHSPPIFGLYCCGQMARWIKMPLSMEVGLGSGQIVLDGDPAPLCKKGAHPHFWPMSIVAKRLHGSRCHLVQW